MSIKIALSTQADSLGYSPNYKRAFESLGCEVTELPLEINEQNIEQIIAEHDGFVITGGTDIDPSLYGDVNRRSVRLCPERDKSDIFLVRALLKADKPILAICRGMQILNIACGGTLYQDIAEQYPESKIIHMQFERSYEYVHKVNIMPESRMKNIYPSVINVNTMHHQAVKDVGEGLIVTAVAPDGVIEAIERPGDTFVLGVQWHPERLITYSEHNALLNMFVEECISKKQKETAL
jgi:putative glutamine amidotransferase